MEDVKRVKIIVVGDSGVGKTSLVHYLCTGNILKNPSWTLGCSLEVKEQPVYLEFWDIGGSLAHENTRSIFLNNINGIMLVYDMSNRKSECNLKKWLDEVYDSLPNGGFEGVSSADDRSREPHVPVLVVGMKSDLSKAVVPQEIDASDASWQQSNKGGYMNLNSNNNILIPGYSDQSMHLVNRHAGAATDKSRHTTTYSHSKFARSNRFSEIAVSIKDLSALRECPIDNFFDKVIEAAGICDGHLSKNCHNSDSRRFLNPSQENGIQTSPILFGNFIRG